MNSIFFIIIIGNISSLQIKSQTIKRFRDQTLTVAHLLIPII